MRIGHIDVNKLRGIGDKAVGLGRELVGTLVGNEGLERAGQAQQAKGTEQLEALRKEADAQKAEARSEVQERRERAAKRSRKSA
jgi:uncharacterized protein YjbJ (UPF0337 family)